MSAPRVTKPFAAADNLGFYLDAARDCLAKTVLAIQAGKRELRRFDGHCSEAPDAKHRLCELHNSLAKACAMLGVDVDTGTVRVKGCVEPFDRTVPVGLEWWEIESLVHDEAERLREEYEMAEERAMGRSFDEVC